MRLMIINNILIAWLYTNEVLEPTLIPFQLDNAHNARITKAYLIHRDPLSTQHVTYTEHLWDQLGQRTSRRYRKPESRQLIVVVLQKKIVRRLITLN